MGHEITHGFDPDGQRFDKNGLINPKFKVSSVKEFNTRAQCLVNDFQKDPLAKENKNYGIKTLNENVADLGGMKAAYNAFLSLNRPKDIKYTTVGITEAQIFFIGFAQSWCGVATPEKTKTMIQNDPHALPSMRVNHVVKNFAPFASVFSCGAGKPLNPTSRCEVW